MSPGSVVNDAYRRRRVLVLGASGFIGRWVARVLSASGAHLTAAVRDPVAFEPVARAWGIESTPVVVDLADTSSVERLLAEVAPDVVFNVAGYGVDRTERDPYLMRRLNTELAGQLGEALSRPGWDATWTGSRLVHVGSALEYGLLTGVASEDRACQPHTPYGVTKLAGTMAVAAVARATGLRCVVARLFTVFGSGEHAGRLLPSLRKAARSGGRARLTSGHQRRDFAYVEDVALALLALGAAPGLAGDVVNVATGRMTTVREFATTAAACLRLALDRLDLGAEEVRDDEMRIEGVAIARLQASAGLVPPADLKAALDRAEAFERALERRAGEGAPA